MTTFTIGDYTVTSNCPGLAQIRLGDESSWPIRTYSGEFSREVAERLVRDELGHRRQLENVERDVTVPFLGHEWE